MPLRHMAAQAFLGLTGGDCSRSNALSVFAHCCLSWRPAVQEEGKAISWAGDRVQALADSRWTWGTPQTAPSRRLWNPDTRVMPSPPSPSAAASSPARIDRAHRRPARDRCRRPRRCSPHLWHLHPGTCGPARLSAASPASREDPPPRLRPPPHPCQRGCPKGPHNLAASRCLARAAGPPSARIAATAMQGPPADPRHTAAVCYRPLQERGEHGCAGVESEGWLRRSADLRSGAGGVRPGGWTQLMRNSSTAGVLRRRQVKGNLNAGRTSGIPLRHCKAGRLQRTCTQDPDMNHSCASVGAGLCIWADACHVEPAGSQRVCLIGFRARSGARQTKQSAVHSCRWCVCQETYATGPVCKHLP